MVISADRYLFMSDDITFHVFTNSDFDLNVFNKNLKRVETVLHKIPDLGWPDATLYRYKYISEYGLDIEADYFVHIDADMLVVPHSSQPIKELLKNKSVALILHPGFWRVRYPKRFYFYAKNVKYIIKDIILYCSYGNLGTWGKNKKSKAYVRRSKRKRYFCGAFWLGEKFAIIKLSSELNTDTNIDLKSGNIPKWNDESYLNSWATKNDFEVLSPELCYEESYKNLEYLNPIIVALDKRFNEAK